MGTQFWWIFDALAVIIVVSVVYSNAKRGLTKVLVIDIGYIVATLLASVLAAVSAPTLYESVARDSNVSAIETTNSKVDFPAIFAAAINDQQYGFNCNRNDILSILKRDDRAEFDLVLYHYACRRSSSELDKEAFLAAMRKTFVSAYGKEVGERLPEYVRMNFVKTASVNSDIMRSIIYEVYDQNRSSTVAAEHIEDQFSKEPTIEVLQIFVYLIIFSILMVFAALLSAAMQNSIFINVRKRTDHTLGGLMGVLEAGVMLVMMTIVVRLLLLLNGGDLLCINEPTIANTKMFHFLYDHLSILL